MRLASITCVGLLLAGCGSSSDNEHAGTDGCIELGDGRPRCIDDGDATTTDEGGRLDVGMGETTSESAPSTGAGSASGSPTGSGSTSTATSNATSGSPTATSGPATSATSTGPLSSATSSTTTTDLLGELCFDGVYCFAAPLGLACENCEDDPSCRASFDQMRTNTSHSDAADSGMCHCDDTCGGTFCFETWDPIFGEPGGECCFQWYAWCEGKP